MAPHGHGNGGVAGEKARDFKGTMKKLMSYLANYKIAIFFYRPYLQWAAPSLIL